MPTSPSRAVVVTGTSSGIGRACALRLTREGFTVFASVRKPADADSLRAEAGERLIPLQLDVTNRESIAAAALVVATELRSRGLQLHGLVNNAGIGLSGPLEFLPLDDVQKIFDVNVIGQIAVTQAMMPMLRQSRGRIVNICSVGDHIAIPFGGALNGSKCAFAMMSESLRMELSPWGMHVVIVEPGAINTPAVDKTLGDPDGALRRMAPEAEPLYGKIFRGFTERAGKRERHGSAPDVVAEAVFHALHDDSPRRRYLVGKGARTLASLPRLMPAAMLDRLRLKMFGIPRHLPDSAQN